MIDTSRIPDIIDSSKDLCKADRERTGRFLDFGWPLMNQATLGLDSGVMIIAGPPNFGKSALCLNIAWQLIEHNADVFVLDFSLDDDRRDRIRSSVARTAKLPINWIKLPNLPEVPPTALTIRRQAYEKWSKTANSHMRIIDETDFDGTARQLSTIREAVLAYHAKLKDDGLKLVVIVDGFHNVIVDEMRGDENQKLTHLSGEMKHLAAVTNSVVIASAQTPKGSMRRGLDQDAVKGPGGSTYDAKLIATAFSDVKVNRSNAQIFHDAELPHNPGTVQRLPVIELDIAKNKVDAFQDIIFYKFVPEYAYIEEAPEQWQEAWRQVLYGASTA